MTEASLKIRLPNTSLSRKFSKSQNCFDCANRCGFQCEHASEGYEQYIPKERLKGVIIWTNKEMRKYPNYQLPLKVESLKEIGSDCSLFKRKNPFVFR